MMQARCFQRVAEHLADGGVFPIEVFVPDPHGPTHNRKRPVP